MPSLRIRPFQSLLRGKAPLPRFPQRRWAQVHDVRYLATHHDPSQVLDRYREKLDQKAKQEGHESVDSLKDAYKDKIEDLRRKASTVATPEPDTPSASPSSPSPSAVRPTPRPQQPASETKKSESSGIKPLDSFIDVQKFLDLPPKEIEGIWRLRHASNPGSICAVIPLEAYRRISAAARQNPQFILPLPRNNVEQEEPVKNEKGEETGETQTTTKAGADIHFLQWAFHPPASPPPETATPAQLANAHTSTIIFTSLAAYKLHGAYAQPHTTITNYLDLAESKGLVLMLGQVMPDAGVSTSEASWLVSCVQRFYDFGGQANERKGELVRSFTRGDTEVFKVEHLMEEAEKL
ncbi:ATP11 family protein [Aspergillus chevalieri]|uniref:F1F0 ATP synthase assembly protein Atp11 n=1 Tax=Aspergillus chevalieri TaxID=182096 RepID=A0A7R7VN12_ASPCH|nr:uncharacterized protein ACHE_40148S [Aspergillus chevalieri]BCR87584.1 hypothetical protein ACHE_40148S [Aspergillus chevalieri]